MQGNTFLTDAKKSTFKELSIMCIRGTEISFIFMYILMVICVLFFSVAGSQSLLRVRKTLCPGCQFILVVCMRINHSDLLTFSWCKSHNVDFYGTHKACPKILKLQKSYMYQESNPLNLLSVFFSSVLPLLIVFSTQWCLNSVLNHI